MSRKPTQKPDKKLSAAELRERRLAEALRANLKRRKASKTPAQPDTSGKPQDDED
jgi:hypothetical protein